MRASPETVELLIDAESGAAPRAIQRFVGHSDIRITLGTYGRLFDHGGDALAESIERRRGKFLNGTSPFPGATAQAISASAGGEAAP